MRVDDVDSLEKMVAEPERAPSPYPSLNAATPTPAPRKLSPNSRTPSSIPVVATAAPVSTTTG